MFRFTVEEIGWPLQRKRSIDACLPHAAMFKYAGEKDDPNFIEVAA